MITRTATASASIPTDAPETDSINPYGNEDASPYGDEDAGLYGNKGSQYGSGGGSPYKNRDNNQNQH